MAKKVTMSELAARAGVDISTVSRALSDSPLVKEDTKERVRAIAEEMGYVVNAAARNLRRQTTQTIGIVVPIDPAKGQTISDPFYLEMVGAVSNAAAKRDYDLLITIPQSDSQIAERRLLQAGKVDGLIVIGQAERSDRLNVLAASNDKVVVWGGAIENVGYTLVGSDNIGGGRSAVEHLFCIGRKKILFIGDIALPEVALRYEGMTQAHKAAGMSHDLRLILPLNFSALTADREVRRALKDGPEFDAIFAASDVLAMAAMRTLLAEGVDIPGDVAVIGYDNVGSAKMAAPPLSTVDQNIAMGGEVMVDLLLRKLAGEKVESKLLPTELIIRESAR